MKGTVSTCFLNDPKGTSALFGFRCLKNTPPLNYEVVNNDCFDAPNIQKHHVNIKYSLVPNRRRASYIRHNLDFPWSSCIAIMFPSKMLGMSCIPPWF